MTNLTLRQPCIEDRLQLIEEDVANLKCALTILNSRINNIENHLNVDKPTSDGVRN